MKLREFDRGEKAVFIASYGALLALGGLLTYVNVPWWGLVLWFVAAVAVLMAYQAWYERRHAKVDPQADPDAEG